MGVRRLIVGSVAEKVIRAAEKPVLVLHPAPFRPSGSAREP
jgi:nucleotide-binding universal stress UspA family protein